MNFLVPKKDKQRHKLLQMVYLKVIANKGRTIMEESTAVKTSDISKELKISVEEVQLLACSLGEGEIKFEDYGQGEVVIAAKDTVTAFASNKYLKSGKDSTVARIKDYLTITISSIAIITAIITATTSLVSILDNRKRIKRLESVVDTMIRDTSKINVESKVK